MSAINYSPRLRYGRTPKTDESWTEKDWHQAATADTGTSHCRIGRVYVIQCEWCDAAFAAETASEAMKMFRLHELEMLS